MNFNFRYLLFTLIFLILLTDLSNAQRRRHRRKPLRRKLRNRVELVYGLGATNTLTDLGGRDQIGSDFVWDLEYVMTRPAFELGGRYLISGPFAVKTSLRFGILRGSDDLTQEPARHNRQLSFRTQLLELSSTFEWYWYNAKRPRHRYRLKGVRGQRGYNVTSYLFLGLGGFYFNPQGQYLDGKWYNLQPLGTEGQNLNPDAKKYSRLSLAFPSGIGIMYRLDKYKSIGFEFGYRFTLTDYLDDVSTDYYDTRVIRTNQGEIAAYFADPSQGGISYCVGCQRGDPTDRDGYMFGIFSYNQILKFRRRRRNLPKF